MMNKSIIAILLLQVAIWIQHDDSVNCHGYAWDADCWVADVRPYLKAPGNDVIVYFDEQNRPIHSAINNGNGWVTSKWGSNGIYTHPVWLSPYGQTWRGFAK